MSLLLVLAIPTFLSLVAAGVLYTVQIYRGTTNWE